MDAQTITQGVSQAEAFFTMIGGLTLVEAVKFGVREFQAYRERKKAAAATLVAAEAARVQAGIDQAKSVMTSDQRLQAAEAMQTREIRRDAVGEWQAIAEERKEEHHNCEKRLDAAEQRLTQSEKDRAELRAGLAECDRDRAELKRQLKGVDVRVTKLENGNDKA